MIDIEKILKELGFNNFMTRLLSKRLQFLKIDEVNLLYKKISEQHGHGSRVTDSILSQLSIALEVKGLENIPKKGPCILIANHPTGIMDGLALLHLVSSVREDVKLVTNYMLTDIEGISRLFKGMLIPVNSFEKEKSRRSSHEGIRMILNAMEQNTALIFFPSGDISSLTPRLNLREGAWNETFLKILAKHSQGKVTPVFIKAKNSFSFYLLNSFSRKIGLILQGRTILRMENSKVPITVGKAININSLVPDPLCHETLECELKKKVYELNRLN